MKKHDNQTNGFLYVLSHPSNPNLLKIGVTKRSPQIRLKEHNTQFDKEAGKIVRETGQLWEISKVIDVDDVYLAEHEFWKRPPLTELPHSFTNELLLLSEGTDLDQRWVQEGLKMAKAAGVRKNPLHPPIHKPTVKRGAKWIEANLEGTGICPVKGIGNGISKVWFECREGHVFKMSGYALIGGYKLLKKPSCPICNPEAFNAQEMSNIKDDNKDTLMTSFSRFFLADRLHPAIELSDGRMLLLSEKGDWNEINPAEILNDERSPQVGLEELQRVIDIMGFKLPR